ncbi:hypothetical protein CHS0354_004847 [Potamilus streckersoni]|uniref:Cell division cycle protein 123 homolog n=1 Tax=Potamilus streckersoni TaxID=2493646 RepID=A0AAE0S9L9_9BIVA|nr:hypothetical protein CHS0354_004847 [Potamilus streckersoni]
MKVENVLNCSFSSWYSLFKDITTKSIVIPLPQEFLEYLLCDGLVLPEQAVDVSSNENADEDNIIGDEIDWSTEDISTPVAEPPKFPDFENIVKKSIQKLGGCVFPKLNWSAPRDAAWISFDKTLKCTCPSDIYLLLKSSDFITHDLTQPFALCEDDENYKNDIHVKYDLVLRKWREFNPSNEFRCFVKNGSLIGICQRHHTMYCSFIGQHKDEIVADIQAFFYHFIQGNFPDKSYVFDVYRRDQGKILLIDFNPFGEVTDGLLFSWEELLGDERLNGTILSNGEDELQVPAFRYIEKSSGVQPNPYTTYAMPKDFVDLATGEDPQKLIDFLRLKVQEQGAEDSSDDESTPEINSLQGQ